MTKVVRNIIRIDEDKCDGCGACVLNCAEGALEIAGGKARVVGEFYCDGLGACVGHCPQDALTIEVRECDDYDHDAVEKKLGKKIPHPFESHGEHAHTAEPAAAPPLGCGCPGSNLMTLKPKAKATGDPKSITDASALGNWPVQIRLVPPHAPFLKGAKLLVAADCAPVATGRFHSEFLPGRVALIGCPKFDPDLNEVRDKFIEIFQQADIKDVTVLEMEVPCCRGTTGVVVAARDAAGVNVPILRTVLSRTGDTLVEERL